MVKGAIALFPRSRLWIYEWSL